MNLAKYEELSGITVDSSDQNFVEATINKVVSKLESMLGYTLDVSEVNDNQYVEIGKTNTDCPCVDSVDVDALLPADAVVYAYRLFPYSKKDRIISIDPCSDVHSVKLVKDGVTFLTLEPDSYRTIVKNGVIKYIELCDSCFTCVTSCDCTQLAVDATWLWADVNNMPSDLLYLFSDMVTYYSNPSKDVKSETLGPHSYTLFSNSAPESLKENVSVLNKYVGPNGSFYRIYTA